MSQRFRHESEPMVIAFYACDECRSVYAGKKGTCPACGTEDPNMTRVVGSRRGLTESNHE